MNVKIIVKLVKSEGGTADHDELKDELIEQIMQSVQEVIVYDEDGEEVIWTVEDVTLG